MDYKAAKLHDCGNDITKRWYVEYYVKNPETGKMDRFRDFISSTIKTKSGRRDKAHTMISEVNKKLAQGWTPFAHSERKYTQLNKALEEIVKVKLSTRKKRTSYTYRNQIKTFVDYLANHDMKFFTVQAFTKYHAIAYADWMVNVKGYANRTFNNHLITLSSAFNEMIKRDYVLFNPFESIERLKCQEAAITAFTDQELRLIASTLPDYNPQLWIIVQLIYYCFLRPQEIMRLRFKDIDLAHRQILLAGWQNKNNKTNVVDIPDPLYPILAAMEFRNPDYYIFSQKLQPGETEQAQTRIDEAWLAYKEHIKMPDLKTIYNMKHTGVGKLVDAGVDLRSVQLQMRHSSLEMTQKYLDKFRRRPNDNLRKLFPVFASY